MASVKCRAPLTLCGMRPGREHVAGGDGWRVHGCHAAALGRACFVVARTFASTIPLPKF